MLPTGFGPVIPTGERPETQILDCAATWFRVLYSLFKNMCPLDHELSCSGRLDHTSRRPRPLHPRHPHSSQLWAESHGSKSEVIGKEWNSHIIVNLPVTKEPRCTGSNAKILGLQQPQFPEMIKSIIDRLTHQYLLYLRTIRATCFDLFLNHLQAPIQNTDPLSIV